MLAETGLLRSLVMSLDILQAIKEATIFTIESRPYTLLLIIILIDSHYSVKPTEYRLFGLLAIVKTAFEGL